MNKRVAMKKAKQKTEAARSLPLGERVRSDIAHGAARVKDAVEQTVDDVVKDVKDEVAARAPALEKRAEAMLESVPLVGHAAAQRLGAMTEKAQGGSAKDAPRN